jgi:tight adherence protein C
MVALLASLLEPRTLVTILVALSAFATVLTLAGPLLQGDKLATRMKQVASERERLRAQARTVTAASEGRLRERHKGVLAQIVELLNLRQLFQAETSREHLRQAGLRSERHLVTYLALRLITPFLFALLVFTYSSTVFADRIPASMRLVATMVGLIAGLLPSQRLPQEPRPAPAGFDQARLVRRA